MSIEKSYVPSSEEVKKAEDMMSSAQKELTANISEHFLQMEKINKTGIVYAEDKKTLDGFINGHKIHLFRIDPIEVHGLVDGKIISSENAMKLFEKYSPIAFNIKEAERLTKRHEQEKNVDEIIQGMLE